MLIETLSYRELIAATTGILVAVAGLMALGFWVRARRRQRRTPPKRLLNGAPPPAKQLRTAHPDAAAALGDSGLETRPVLLQEKEMPGADDRPADPIQGDKFALTIQADFELLNQKLRDLGEKDVPDVPKQQRLACLEQRHGPLPDFIRALFEE